MHRRPLSKCTVTHISLEDMWIHIDRALMLWQLMKAAESLKSACSSSYHKRTFHLSKHYEYRYHTVTWYKHWYSDLHVNLPVARSRVCCPADGPSIFLKGARNPWFCRSSEGTKCGLYDIRYSIYIPILIRPGQNLWIPNIGPFEEVDAPKQRENIEINQTLGSIDIIQLYSKPC